MYYLIQGKHTIYDAIGSFDLFGCFHVFLSSKFILLRCYLYQLKFLFIATLKEIN